MLGFSIKYTNGVGVCLILAVVAHVLSTYFGGPYMLYALGLGMGVSRWAYKNSLVAGIDFTGKKVLQVGVALLGARITFAELSSLGFGVVWAMVVSVLATIVFGVVMGRILGVGTRMGVLTGGATAICGASATIAVSSVLPQDKKLAGQTLFTVVGVNVLSTVAMVAYPLIALWLGYDTLQSGVFLGGSIHDVAQVVGAGFSMSESVGEMATITKLLRVSMLLPIVFALAAIVYMLSKRGRIAKGGEVNAPFPYFLVVFLLLVAGNSLGVLSFSVPFFVPFFVDAHMSISTVLVIVSKWMLTMAVIALGMKTSVQDLMAVGHRAVILLVFEAVFIAVVVLAISSYVI